MAECGWLDPLCNIGEGFKNLADSAISDFVRSLYEGAVAFVSQVSTFWMDIPSPDVANPAVASLRADMSWYVAGFAVLGFLAGLIKLLTSQDIKNSLINLATPIVNLILATAVYATGISLLITASDQFARWILQRSTGGEIDFTQLLVTTEALLASPGSAFVLFLLLFIGAIVNLLFMYFRDVMFLILAAFIIALAAASGTESGRQAWRKANGWLIALLLFKPVAAGIYALGFRMLINGVGTGEDEATKIIDAMHASLVAVLILLLAALALPALVKFIVPAAGVGAGAFSGGAALGAGITLAAGAAIVASSGAATPVATGTASTAATGSSASTATGGGGSGGGGGGATGNGAPGSPASGSGSGSGSGGDPASGPPDDGGPAPAGPGSGGGSAEIGGPSEGGDPPAGGSPGGQGGEPGGGNKGGNGGQTPGHAPSPASTAGPGVPAGSSPSGGSSPSDGPPPPQGSPMSGGPSGQAPPPAPSGNSGPAPAPDTAPGIPHLSGGTSELGADRLNQAIDDDEGDTP